MLSSFRRKLKLLRSKIRRFLRARPRPKLAIRRLGKWYAEVHPKRTAAARSDSPEHSLRPIRVATFNVAMFSLAPATARTDPDPNPKSSTPVRSPKGILKQPPSSVNSNRSGRKVSINLPENEIALANNKLFAVPARSPLFFPGGAMPCWDWRDGGGRSVVEVLREVDADILALQDVKAEEEKAMRPLSELASALGMKYVFAESWAPEYGNAVLSKWPIKRWRVQKIADNDDFRNVLKAVIEVPWAGEVSIYCTQLDHLDETWRMKQISSLFSHATDNSPHILAGGINSLTASDYSSQRWTDIVKYYEEMGKPTPKTEVTKFLKGKGYIDSKDYAGECEPVVIIAKGQNVQGTCKYGTRVDYVLSSSESPYKFVPGSYSVVSSKGTSDHHMVTVDVVKELKPIAKQNDLIKRHKKCLQKLVRCSSKGFWNINE